MAIATPESYADMLDRAKAGKYAVPAINVTSSQTLSAALKGFADAESDGIVQISNGGASYWSGASRGDRVKGSIAFAAYARAVGDLYPGVIGLHTDHCPKAMLEPWILPLLEMEAEQVKRGELPMFNSHMWDGSAESLEDNIEIAVDMLELAPRLDHAVLFSGDGDFRVLVEAVQRRGSRVTVVSTVKSQPPMASDDLRRQADNFVDLADLADIIGRPSRLPRFIQESRAARDEHGQDVDAEY